MAGMIAALMVICFGADNAFFSGIAFAGIIIILVLQSKELALPNKILAIGDLSNSVTPTTYHPSREHGIVGAVQTEPLTKRPTWC